MGDDTLYDQGIVFSLVERAPHDVVAAGDRTTSEWINGTWVARNYGRYRGSPAWRVTTRGNQLWGIASVPGGDAVVRLEGTAWVRVGKALTSGEFNQVTTDRRGRIWAVGIPDVGSLPRLFEYRCN